MIIDALLNESMLNNKSSIGNIQPTNNGYEPSGAGMSQILFETMQESHALNTAMYIADYKSLQLLHESGSEAAMMLQENVVTDFFKKVREIIASLWAKMMELFNKVKSFFKSSKSESFMTAHGEALKNAKTNGFTYNGYSFRLEALNLSITSDKIDKAMGQFGEDSKNPEATVSHIKSLKDKEGIKKYYEKLMDNSQSEEFHKKILDSIRGDILGESGGVSVSEFKEKAFEKLRGKEKINITVNAEEIAKSISGAEEEIKAISTAQSQAQQTFKDALKYVDQCYDTFNKASKEINDPNDPTKHLMVKAASMYQSAARVRKSATTIIGEAFGFKIQAAKDQLAQNMDIARKLVAHNKKNGKAENVNASTEFNGEGSILSELMSRMS